MRFRDRGQLPGENVETWVAELRRLVVPCKYRDTQDEEENIRDQLVKKNADPKVRQRLLMEEDLNLEKAITIASYIEQAFAHAKAIANQGSSVNRVRSTAKGDEGSARKTKKGACFRCGEDGHFARDPECPARRATCDKCGRKGHFARVCQSDSDDEVADRVGRIDMNDQGVIL